MTGETSQSDTAAPETLLLLLHELAAARDQTDQLFRAIQPFALLERPIDERHRLIFYLGHLEAFDWNLLARKGLDAPSFHPAFDKLFERGIDPVPGSATKDLPSDWPDRREIEDYNSRTRNWIDSHLIYMDPCLLQMAIEHRHMHAETTAYLLHALDYSEKQSPRSLAPLSGPTPANSLVEIPAGTAHLGTDGNGFAWDNERHPHQIAVPAFRMSRFKVSNGEYLAFVQQGAPAPHFWVQRNGEWFFRGMFTEIPLPLDWPVWVMWDESAAYAKFRGLALPSEAQFHRASTFTPPDPVRDNFGYQRWDPIPVNFGAGANPWPHQLTGNGWEWTRDIFAPFAGFEPHPAYPGYSADFFDDRHYVMKGASPRTATVLTRPGFRNWFRPNYPHMYAGFHLIAP
jgi:formylglycine-generating enzyme required for sulfatase activity